MPAHAGLNPIGKAVFVIPPLCSQKHSPKGRTNRLRKTSTPTGGIFLTVQFVVISWNAELECENKM